MRINWFKTTALALVVSGSFSVSAADIITQNHESLNDLKNLNFTQSKKSSVKGIFDPKDIRVKDMRKTALAVGAQNGFVQRVNELKSKINDNKDSLDNIFDFNVLMKLSSGELEEMYLLPPVISTTKNMTTISDSATRIRISGTMYNIDKPARLATNAPNWRQYLIFDQPVDITKPVANLLPRDSNESLLWENWVEQGWYAGHNQAEREMSYRVRRLGQDFVGMTRYMILASEGKVNKPVVISSTDDVSGGGSQMRINDQVIQLAVPAQLNTNDNDWEALILDTRQSLRYPDEQKLNVENK